uniref:Transmembrane protein n=1 Tax=Fagus sylvatica TaxID=28930 RepID=A0A2N9EVB3_FAGSY
MVFFFAGVKEFIVFVARTAAKRTPPSQHQSVQHRGGETFMLFYPLQRHHPSTCVLTLTPNAFANITGSDPSELCFSTNSAVIFIEVLEVAYAVIFIGKKKIFVLGSLSLLFLSLAIEVIIL